MTPVTSRLSYIFFFCEQKQCSRKLNVIVWFAVIFRERARMRIGQRERTCLTLKISQQLSTLTQIKSYAKGVRKTGSQSVSQSQTREDLPLGVGLRYCSIVVLSKQCGNSIGSPARPFPVNLVWMPEDPCWCGSDCTDAPTCLVFVSSSLSWGNHHQWR